MNSLHTTRAFDQEFDLIRGNVVRMADLVTAQLERAMSGLATPDESLLGRILHDEVEVNRLQVSIDRLCNQLIVRYQPTAIDLREAIATLHLIGDLERVGDEAKKTALRTRKLGGPLPEVWLAPLQQMAGEASSMLGTAIRAYTAHDVAAYADLQARDWQLGDRRTTLIQRLVADVERTPSMASRHVELIMVVRSIERVGDHATNIGRYVVSIVQGSDRTRLPMGETDRIDHSDAVDA